VVVVGNISNLGLREATRPEIYPAFLTRVNEKESPGKIRSRKKAVFQA
jgi:hypothetical protein